LGFEALREAVDVAIHKLFSRPVHVHLVYAPDIQHSTVQ
jgi:hypothetical protein